jgi:hypothetical protein
MAGQTRFDYLYKYIEDAGTCVFRLLRSPNCDEQARLNQ